MSDVLNPPENAEGSTGVPLKPLGKVVAVTSGKGGVGKPLSPPTWQRLWPNAATVYSCWMLTWVWLTWTWC